MYVPQHFRLPDDRVTDLLSAPHAGNLVTVHEDGPRATLIPFHLEQRDTGQVLVTHLVRNNPQAREPITGPGLAIIDITDAYVSPHWYATNAELPNVPTWDYITIHLTGPVHLDPSPDAALRAARALTLQTEDEATLDALGEERLTRMSRAIVAVELQVEHIEAKAKMSQNRHPDDIRGLIEHYSEHGPTDVADYLREVSLPYAEARFSQMADLRASGGRGTL